MIKIETASVDDIPELTGLLGILFSREHEFTPDSKKQKTGLELIIKNPGTGRIFVLKNDAQVIGMVSILNSVSTALGAKVGILEDMIIHPEFQRKGLGKKLILHALEYAQKEGLKRITLLTDNDNTDAAAFYRKTGFTKSDMAAFRILI